MKISFKEPDHKINQGQGEGLVSILLNVLLIAGVVLLIGLSARLLVGFLAPKIPFSLELKLGRVFSSMFDSARIKSDEKVEGYISDLITSAAKNSPIELPQINSSVVCLNFENAFALPGAQILITSKLIEALQSEEELYMVLGHEVGHIVHRDNMQILGNAAFELVMLLVISPVLNDGAERIVDMASLLSSTSYSRAQEIDADHFGVGALQKQYGEISGAFRLFEEFKKIEKREFGEAIGMMQSLTMTHPHSEYRAKLMHADAARNGWKEKGDSARDITWLKERVKAGCEGKERKFS